MRHTRKAQPRSDPQKEVRLFDLLPQSDCSDCSALRQALGALKANEHRLPLVPASPDVERQLGKVLADLGMV
jgi:hypothetical protein